MRGVFVALLFCMVVAVALLAGAFYHGLWSDGGAGSASVAGSESFKLGVARLVRVYHGDEKVYEEYVVNDPVTANWYRLVANWLFALYYWDRQTVHDINGADSSVFDNAFGGTTPKLEFYVSNSTEQIGFDTYTVQNLTQGTIDITDASNTTHYVLQITGTFTNTWSTNYTVRKVVLILVYDTDITTDTSTTKTLFIVDDLGTEVELATNDAISITWWITVSKKHLTDTGWSILKLFMGSSGSSTPDFGADYNSVSDYDYVNEKLYFAPVNGTSEIDKYLFDRVLVYENSTGIYLVFYGHYVATADAEITGVNVYLYSDTDTSVSVQAGYFKILSYSLNTPVELGQGDTLIVRIVVSLPNYFG